MIVTKRLLRWLAAAGLATALAACGGGDGDEAANAGPQLEAPPTTAAMLAQSGSEAMAAVQALNDSASLLLSKSAALQGGSLFAPVRALGSPLNLGHTVAGAVREQALARETVACANLGLVSCSGSVTFDYNFADNAAVLPARSYFAMSFDRLSGDAGSATLSMNGLFRIDFLTALDINALDFANARFQVTLDNLSGTVDGISFGPETALALYEFDPRGTPTVTIDGLRIQGGVQATDAQNYSVINGTNLRTAHWSNSGGYVDVEFGPFGNWFVVQGRASAGSAATISGVNASMTINVQSASQGEVVYVVRYVLGDATTTYLVTATYANDVPSYSAIQVPN
jgi:hypothetical protein